MSESMVEAIDEDRHVLLVILQSKHSFLIDMAVLSTLSLLMDASVFITSILAFSWQNFNISALDGIFFRNLDLKCFAKCLANLSTSSCREGDCDLERRESEDASRTTSFFLPLDLTSRMTSSKCAPIVVLRSSSVVATSKCLLHFLHDS